jgi:hypothetical protein
MVRIHVGQPTFQLVDSLRISLLLRNLCIERPFPCQRTQDARSGKDLPVKAPFGQIFGQIRSVQRSVQPLFVIVAPPCPRLAIRHEATVLSPDHVPRLRSAAERVRPC